MLRSQASATAELAEFGASLRFSGIPPEAVAMAKRLVLDCIGCGAAGAGTALGNAAMSGYRGLATAEGRSHIFGQARPTVAEVAALVNAFYMNALDFDESSEYGHPGATLAATSLALAEEVDCAGADLIAAVVAGYEVGERVAASIWPSLGRENDVWGIGVHQTLGAAASACNLARLPVDQAAETLGLAGVMASLPSARQWNWGDRPLSWHKDSVAWAAFSGTQALRLRQGGFLGPRRVLEGGQSLWRMTGSDQTDAARLTADLGGEWRILESVIKPYSCCRWIHSILDAAAKATGGRALAASEVARVDIHGVGLMTEYGFLDPTPANIVDAEFSVNYTIAVLLLGIPPGPEWYEPARLEAEEVTSLARRVYFKPDDVASRRYEADRACMPARVAVELTSGESLVGSVEYPSGGPEEPPAEGFVESKFRRLATPSLGPGRAERILAGIDRLEELDSVRDFLRMSFVGGSSEDI